MKVLRKALLKLLDEILSVKVHILVVSTIALFLGKLESSAYASIVAAIGLGRVLIESIVANRSKVDPNLPISSNDENSKE